jgi:hypothetical protein
VTNKPGLVGMPRTKVVAKGPSGLWRELCTPRVRWVRLAAVIGYLILAPMLVGPMVGAGWLLYLAAVPLGVGGFMVFRIVGFDGPLRRARRKVSAELSHLESQGYAFEFESVTGLVKLRGPGGDVLATEHTAFEATIKALYDGKVDRNSKPYYIMWLMGMDAESGPIAVKKDGDGEFSLKGGKA